MVQLGWAALVVDDPVGVDEPDATTGAEVEEIAVSEVPEAVPVSDGLADVDMFESARVQGVLACLMGEGR